jgi:hypothetical protein
MSNATLPSKYQLFAQVAYKYDNSDPETRIGQVVSVKFTPSDVIYNLVNFKTGELNVDVPEEFVSTIN